MLAGSPTRAYRRLIVVNAVFLAGVGVVPASTDTGPEAWAHGIYHQLRSAMPIQSADGAIRVYGTDIDRGRRLLFLRFVEEWRIRFARFTGIPAEIMPTDLTVISNAESFGEGDGRILRAGTGPARAWLRVHLESDGSVLRDRLCQAWLEVWWLDRGLDVLPPPFLAPGLSRHIEADHRLGDNEAVLARWSDARLPGIVLLLKEAFAHPRQDPALSALLCQFMLHGAPRAARLRAMASPAADIALYTPEWVSWILFGVVDLAALDESWDLWLLSRRSAVIIPGVISDGILERFRAQLLLFPGESGTPLRKPLMFGEPFERLIAHRHTRWAHEAAEAKSVDLMRFAAGRHVALQEVAGDYVAILHGIRKGASETRLRNRLQQANDKLKQLEREVSASVFDSKLPEY